MREIEFRGKSKRLREWFYGDLGHTNINGINIGTLREVCFDIDPSTVGQYTGLKDKNGKKIYEGDVFEFVSMDIIDTDKNVVLFKDGCFGIELYNELLSLESIIHKFNVCIIGNIHDNPELIKKGE